jgi:hypothetical protein
MNQNIKDVVLLGVSVAELVDSVADGVSLGDVFSVVGVLKKVKPAIDAVKSGKLIDEYKALDQAGKDELVKWFEEELDLKDDKVEAMIEQAWKVVVDLNDLVKLLKP